MPPSEVPTGWDVRFLAGRRCRRWCGGTGERRGGGQESRDPEKAPGREKLLGGNRLEGTQLAGIRPVGNRPGTEQQLQQQPTWQQLQQRWQLQLQGGRRGRC